MIRPTKKISLIILGVIILAATAVFVLGTRNRYAVPNDWKTYSNEKFGVQFRYPPTWQVCELPLAYPDPKYVTLYFVMSQTGTCVTSLGKTTIDGDVHVNISNSLAETSGQLNDPDLVQLFSYSVDMTINPQLQYFMLDGLPAYGGPVIRHKGQKPSGYKVAISHKGNNIDIEDANEGNSYPPHPETEIFVHSFRFDPEKYPR